MQMSCEAELLAIGSGENLMETWEKSKIKAFDEMGLAHDANKVR